MEDHWRALRQTVRDTAEGYAATHRTHATAYRREAADFAALDAPANAEELKAREAQAEAIRRTWSDRFRRRRAGEQN